MRARKLSFMFRLSAFVLCLSSFVSGTNCPFRHCSTPDPYTDPDLCLVTTIFNLQPDTGNGPIFNASRITADLSHCRNSGILCHRVWTRCTGYGPPCGFCVICGTLLSHFHFLFLARRARPS
ncbi:hypothetical protein C8R47DRAFT_149085 [Mycena vitilis]|nr:hypothetical protein C8R47DRAFT_443361 [Mycena vitilis]KAJ6458395.1 hypothetical protein C8R47DRAFT_149085 [Mycena vitilis]